MLIGTLSEHTLALADGLGEAEVVAVPEPPAGLAGSWDWDWAPVLERWRSDFELGFVPVETTVGGPQR